MLMKTPVIQVPISGELIKYVREIHVMESDATNEKIKQIYVERHPHSVERWKKLVSTVPLFNPHIDI